MKVCMTIISLVALVIVSGFSANCLASDSPIGRGSSIATGTMSFTSSGGSLWNNERGDNLFEFESSPGGGFFILDGLSINAYGSHRYSKQGDDRSEVWSLGPRVQYYFDFNKSKLEAKGKFFPSVGLAYLWTKKTLKYSETGFPDDKFSGNTIRVDAGGTYMLSNSIGISMGVYFAQDRFKQKEPIEFDSQEGNRVGIELGWTAFLF